MFKLIFIVLFCFQFLNIFHAAPTPSSSKWDKQTLTYSISKTPINISEKDTQAAIRAAFDQIKKLLTPSKTFTNVPENDPTADFQISFITPKYDIRISSALPNGKITFTADDKFKYHKIGEKVDPQKRDLIYSSMSSIKAVLAMNNIISDKIFVSENFTDSNGNYILPKFIDVGKQ